MSEIKINMSSVDKKKERFGLTTAEAEAVSASAFAWKSTNGGPKH
jgi:hypothetical protein